MRTPAMARRLAAVPAILIAVVALGACASAPAGEREPYATVVIDNDNPATVTVYALRSGTRYRLGTVSGLSTQEFPLRHDMVNAGGDLVLLVDPLGSPRMYPSDSILVREGDVVELKVSAFLR